MDLYESFEHTNKNGSKQGFKYHNRGFSTLNKHESTHKDAVQLLINISHQTIHSCSTLTQLCVVLLLLIGKLVPKIDNLLSIIVVGVRHEWVVEFLCNLLLVGEQLLLIKDIIWNHRKFPFFKFCGEYQTPNNQILKLTYLDPSFMGEVQINKGAS